MILYVLRRSRESLTMHMGANHHSTAREWLYMHMSPLSLTWLYIAAALSVTTVPTPFFFFFFLQAWIPKTEKNKRGRNITIELQAPVCMDESSNQARRHHTTDLADGNPREMANIIIRIRIRISKRIRIRIRIRIRMSKLPHRRGLRWCC